MSQGCGLGCGSGLGRGRGLRGCVTDALAEAWPGERSGLDWGSGLRWRAWPRWEGAWSQRVGPWAVPTAFIDCACAQSAFTPPGPGMKGRRTLRLRSLRAAGSQDTGYSACSHREEVHSKSPTGKTPLEEPGMLSRHAEGTVIWRSLTRALGVMLRDSGTTWLHGKTWSSNMTQLCANMTTCDMITGHTHIHTGMSWLYDTTTWLYI